MNILHLLSSGNNYDALAQTVELSRQLSRRGHQCTIVSLKDLIPLGHDLSGVEYETLAGQSRRRRSIPGLYSKIRTLVKKNNIDIVHAHSPFLSWMALFLARSEAVPFITSCHEFYAYNYFRRALVLGKALIVHHEALGQYLSSVFSAAIQQLHFIKPAIDAGSFRFELPDTHSPTGYTIMVPWFPDVAVDSDSFLKGMAKAIRTIPNTRIFIADSAPDRGRQKKKELLFFLRKLGLSRHVDMCDASKGVGSRLGQSTLLALPFLKETAQARIILEAQACGTVIVANRVAGVSELIADAKTGILVPPRDHNAFCEAVVGLMRNTGQARALASEARKRTEEEYNYESFIQQLMPIYQRAVDRKKVFVIAIGSIGQTIASIPALGVFKKENPTSSLTLLTRPLMRSVFEHCPYIETVKVVHSCRGKIARIFNSMKLFKAFTREQFDIVVDFSNTFLSRLFSQMSFAHKYYGAHHSMHSLLFSDKKRHKEGLRRLISRGLSIVAPRQGQAADNQRIELWPSSKDSVFVDQLLNEYWVGNTKVVALDISPDGEFFRQGTSIEQLAYLCDMLAESNMRVVVVGFDVAPVRAQAMRRHIHSKPIFATGDISAMQFIALIKRCDLYISGSKELLELALSLHIPCLLLSAGKASVGPEGQSGDEAGIKILSRLDIQSAMTCAQRKRPKNARLQKSTIVNTIQEALGVPR